MIKEKKQHYCNNKELLSWLIEYKKLPKGSKKYNQYLDKICLAISAIANNYSLNGKFINYTFRDDMVADAIYACVKAINNFNPERSSNPFAYFTQISGNAFIARITKEKEQAYIRQKAMTNYFDMVDFDGEDSEVQEAQLQVRESYGIDGENDGFDYFRRKEQESIDRREQKKLEPVGIEKIFEEANLEETY